MKNILVIEGNRHLQEHTDDQFRTSTHRIQFASTTSDAVLLAESAVPDAVIISMLYLDQHGFETLQHATRLFPTSRILAIATTVAAVEYSGNTCLTAYRLRADLLSAVRELLALVDEGFWDGEGEGPCPTHTLA